MRKIMWGMLSAMVLVAPGNPAGAAPGNTEIKKLERLWEEAKFQETTERDLIKAGELYGQVVQMAAVRSDWKRGIEAYTGAARCAWKSGKEQEAWEWYYAADNLLEDRGVYGATGGSQLQKYGIILSGWEDVVRELRELGMGLLNLSEDQLKLKKNDLALLATPPLGWASKPNEIEIMKIKSKSKAKMVVMVPVDGQAGVIIRPKIESRVAGGAGMAPRPASREVVERLKFEGDVHYGNGRIREAIDAWRKVLELNPEDLDSHQKIQSVEKELQHSNLNMPSPGIVGEVIPATGSPLNHANRWNVKFDDQGKMGMTSYMGRIEDFRGGPPAAGPVGNEQGEVRNGKKQGHWKAKFYGTDILAVEGDYRDDLRTGLWVYYAGTGRRTYQFTYQNGKPNGEAILWHPNGQMESQGDYRDGRKVGEWVYYDLQGREVERETIGGGR